MMDDGLPELNAAPAEGSPEPQSVEASEARPHIEKPEIYIALCGAAGTNITSIVKEIGKQLNGVGYKSKEIVVSDIFLSIKKYEGISSIKAEDERIDQLMNAGNEIRKTMDSGDAAARLAVSYIRNYRTEVSGDPDKPVEGVAYIIKSLKTVEEYETLASMYKDAFFMISAYEPKKSREKNLCVRVAKSRKLKVDDDKVVSSVEKIIERDENEIGVSYGQSVRDVFQLADVFVSAESKIDTQIKRIIDLVFGSPFITPTKDEYGMFHAYAASLKSADLARQVGAVIVSDEGDIISSGCNEVPKVGGGTIWEEEVVNPSDERRDFGLGYDTTAIMKREILTEVVQVIKGEWLKEEIVSKSDADLVDQMLDKRSRVSLKDARISNIIEFGRIVHAEMSSLMSAARRGVATQGRTLYCTTFPCHMCARHIVASGISRVFYIEPYPKSLAKKLYEKEIVLEDEKVCGAKAVRFIPFVGVAPKRYMNWFKAGTRKDSAGWALKQSGSAQTRKIARSVWAPPDIEIHYEKTLSKLEVLDS